MFDLIDTVTQLIPVHSTDFHKPVPLAAAGLLTLCMLIGLSLNSAKAQKGFIASFSEPGLPDGFTDTFSHHFAEANGVRLHYVSGGPADGELVVLLHGWPQTWYTWRYVMPLLAESGYRVVAVDYRGAGRSEKPKDGYEKATMAADIRALVNQFEKKKVTLVARDIGLMVAYAYAAQWPEEVKRLAMLDVPVPGTKAWYEAKKDPQTWHFDLHQQRDVAEMLIDGQEYEYIRHFYKKRLHNLQFISDKDIAVYANAYASPGGLRTGFELYRAFPEDEEAFKKFLETKLPMPVLALAGEYSGGETMINMAKNIAENVHGGVVPNAGHWLPDERPIYLSEKLKSFFKDTP
jgi:pimeloyl-ACP methyl ester carboxylesterase